MTLHLPERFSEIMNVEHLAPGLAPHGHSINGFSEVADPSKALISLVVSGRRNAFVHFSSVVSVKSPCC